VAKRVTGNASVGADRKAAKSAEDFGDTIDTGAEDASDTWRGFAPGEALFLGATCSDGTDVEGELQYSVAYSKNATGLGVPDWYRVTPAQKSYWSRGFPFHGGNFVTID
jgi:hypothetical protein